MGPEGGLLWGQVIEEVDGVRTVEQAKDGDDRIRLSALAQSGHDILIPIGEGLQTSGLAVEQVSVQAGHLDDVFRVMTTNVEAPATSPQTPPNEPAQSSTARRQHAQRLLEAHV